jgi:hypothetical protein
MWVLVRAIVLNEWLTTIIEVCELLGLDPHLGWLPSPP